MFGVPVSSISQDCYRESNHALVPRSALRYLVLQRRALGYSAPFFTRAAHIGRLFLAFGCGVTKYTSLTLYSFNISVWVSLQHFFLGQFDSFQLFVSFHGNAKLFASVS